MPISTVECCDCMDFMAKFPDKYFELAIVDPPYGIGAGGKSFINRNTANKRAESFYKDNDWDKIRPSKEYFAELERVSKNQIIWGANYFTDLLKPSRCFIVWDKKTGDNSYADCELALTSFDANAKIFVKLWLGAHAQDTDGRIHPTQKPVALYVWLLQNYAKLGDKILDTHMGSQSSRIAAHRMGFDFWGCEIDPEYFADGCKRFEKETRQLALFTPETTTREQNKLFEEGLG
jgi:site-specific DNA-methyltransferase (adenine-specific)